MVLMRRLLVDAQTKFRKMMSDNKALALRIDQDIQSAHHQVSVLRAELADTNQRINDICCTPASSPNGIMAGNVITTCMPPTSTTNTAVNSTAEGHWGKDSQSSDDLNLRKNERVGSPSVDGKSSAQGRSTSIEVHESEVNRSNKDGVQLSSKPKVQERITIITKQFASEQSSMVYNNDKTRESVRRKDELHSRLRSGDGQRGSPLRNGGETYGPSSPRDQPDGCVNSSPEHSCKHLASDDSSIKSRIRDMQKIPLQKNGSNDQQDGDMSKNAFGMRQDGSPSKRGKGSQHDVLPLKDVKCTEQYESSSNENIVPLSPDIKQAQQKGPHDTNSHGVASSSDFRKEPKGVPSAKSSTIDQHSGQEQDLRSNRKTGPQNMECHKDHQIRSRKEGGLPSQESGIKLNSPWITQTECSSKFSDIHFQELKLDSSHQAPASKIATSHSVDNQPTKDFRDRHEVRENRPFYHQWCSDTGDSLSDILTSDDCTKEQSEPREIGFLPNAQNRQTISEMEEKKFGNRKEITSFRNCAEYSSFRSNPKMQDETISVQRFRQLESENESLRIKCSALQRDLEEVMESRDEKAKENAAMAAKLERTEKELKHAKEALSALKQDRKRLKAEKFDLLTQMKQLYSHLEDKENELREFIRNYEQKVKESDENFKQMSREREELEQEKWSILKRARDEAERAVLLCTQVGLKDAHIKELQDEINVLREKSAEQELRQTNGFGSPGSVVSYRTLNGLDSRGTPTPTPGSDPTTSSSYSGTPTIAAPFPGSKDSGSPRSDESHRPALLSRSAEDLFESGTEALEGRKKMAKCKEKKGTWGSISRVFSRNKQRRKALDPDLFQDTRASWSPKGSVCSSPLSEESYVQKVRVLEETQGTPMQQWRAQAVLAWLELAMDMPQYGTLCAENIKSGKVLLELSESELEEGLGISNVMHRRKLRLAIEEHREPSLCRYPKICQLTHSWVVEEWLPSLALTCYLPSFSEHLVDGRVMDTLSRKDLEKHFGITRKFHQNSILHAIQLLRMLHFDRQILHQRRLNSENMDVDPLVWSNLRFVRWAASIDLGEYAENLRNSGVHGALAVLEPSFTAEGMAAALGIPASKNIIRRHLTTEWQNLIQPARLSLESESVVAKKSKGEKRLVSGSSSTSLASQGKNSLVQSYARRTLDRYDRRRSSWRFSTWRSSQESLKSTSSKKAPPPVVERPRLLPLSPKLNSSRHRRTFSSHSDVETLTVTPV